MTPSDQSEQLQPNDPRSTSGVAGDARRSRRVPASDLGEFAKARLLPGGEVDVINISGTGLLVEGRSRPAVGTGVSIRLEGCSLKRLDGRIVRSRVSTIHRDGTLSYESAIEFDRPHAIEELVDAYLHTDSDGLDGGSNPSAPDVYVLDAGNDW